MTLLRPIPSLTGKPPSLADSPATALARTPMLASMNAERVLSMSEGDMIRANRVQAWVLGVALLAGGEFSYAHLRQLGLWPLELAARSVWRLVSMLAAAVFPGNSLWTAPLGTILIALLLWGIAIWRRQRRAAAPSSEGRRHE